MTKNGRFLLGLTAATMLLWSCSADDGARRGEPSAPPVAISFSAMTEDNGITRTASNTLTLDGSGTNEMSLRANGFGVFASHTGFHPYVSSTTTSNLMWNQQVADTDMDGTWTYSPITYWPNSDENVNEYVTFFAYAPYSDGSTDAASACIKDFSLAGETGDPWLLYQLGGSETANGPDGWKARQVDLLYDFQKDQLRPFPVMEVVRFHFKHALACVGDYITLTCSDDLQDRLKALSASTGNTVTLAFDLLSLHYELTSKAKLVLNGSTQPNWKVVDSGETMVHRYLALDPENDFVLATATSGSSCTLTDYMVSNQGIFYIPIEVGNNIQKVTATIYYVVSTGQEGVVKATVNLNPLADAGNGRHLNLILSIPDL